MLEAGLLVRKSNFSGVLFLVAVLKFCLPPVFVLGLLELGGQADQARSETQTPTGCSRWGVVSCLLGGSLLHLGKSYFKMFELV